MASLVQNNFKRGLLAGEFDLHTGGDDIRAVLVMTNTTADTEDEETLMNGFTTLDESDATGYARQALANEVVNQDNPNNRAEFDADDVSFAGLGGDATRDYQGCLIYKHVTNDTDSIPLFFVEFSNQPLAKEATQVDVPWDAQGILQLN
jgi:hypothetical protein